MDKSIIDLLDEEVRTLMEEVAKDGTTSDDKIKLLRKIETLSKVRNENGF